TMEELPASLIIVGGGVIGVEWASMLNDFGVEVTVVEAANRLIPTEDEDVSREMQRLLTKRGVKVLTGSQVLAKTYGKDEEGVQIDVQKGEETETLSASKLLISVGRQANVENIGLENTDIR
ncbi:FAD-dependent oxidoreductase, partial [Bacillus cereus]|nr:FAD-dependent oxidoreductase [Bacillus cereus]